MIKMISKEDYYFRIDERQNTLDSLHKTRVFLSKIDEDEFYWKRAMIALHNALYGSMILVLQGTNPVRVEDKKKTEQMKKLRQKKNPLEADTGERYVISFNEALRRIQRPEFMKMYVGSKFVCITPEAEKYKQMPEHSDKAEFFAPELSVSLEHLNDYIRNQFLHYFPISISFGKGGFVQIIADIAKLIEFLLLRCGNFRIDSDEESNFIKGEISAISDLVTGLKGKHLPNE